jgi:multimeric flavodoxin WrbA
MKVLLINGSRRKSGCTYTALKEVADVLESEKISTEIIHVGIDAVNGNIDKAVKETAAMLDEVDGIVLGSPVYYASPSGEIQVFLDRLFYIHGDKLKHKPGAVVASARRAGTTAALDVLNKYLMINEMPVVSSQYWTMVHGNSPEEVRQDAEGMQTMRILGKNMAWLLQCIEAGRQAGILPERTEERVWTNFVR